MELLRVDRHTVELRMPAEELAGLHHMTMTANLTFDELDTVPYDATREGVASCAAFLEALTEEAGSAEATTFEMTHLLFDDMVSTVYTLDISFHEPAGNPFKLTQAMITDYSRKLMWVQDAVVKQMEAVRP